VEAMKLKLVENWKAAPKWLSMQFLALSAIWAAMPAEAKTVIPSEWHGYITLLLFLGVALGRLIYQGTEVKKPEDAQ
jgi:hypothetical protein